MVRFTIPSLDAVIKNGKNFLRFRQALFSRCASKGRRSGDGHKCEQSNYQLFGSFSDAESKRSVRKMCACTAMSMARIIGVVDGLLTTSPYAIG